MAWRARALQARALVFAFVPGPRAGRRGLRGGLGADGLQHPPAPQGTYKVDSTLVVRSQESVQETGLVRKPVLWGGGQAPQ